MVAGGLAVLASEDEEEDRLIQSATARMAPRLSVELVTHAREADSLIEASKVPEGWPHSLPGNASLWSR